MTILVDSNKGSSGPPTSSLRIPASFPWVLPGQPTRRRRGNWTGPCEHGQGQSKTPLCLENAPTPDSIGPLESQLPSLQDSALLLPASVGLS